MHALQWVSLTVDLAVIALLVRVTAVGGDAWPFSAYPMFGSRRKSPPYQRFFDVRFHLADGRIATLPIQLEGALEAFQAEFGLAWQEPATRAETTRAIVHRLWARASQVESSLGRARQLEVRLTVVQVGPRGGLSATENSLGRFAAPAGRG